MVGCFKPVHRVHTRDPATRLVLEGFAAPFLGFRPEGISVLWNILLGGPTRSASNGTLQDRLLDDFDRSQLRTSRVVRVVVQHYRHVSFSTDTAVMFQNRGLGRLLIIGQN